MGVDDYKNDGTANILNDNIRLIGTNTGLLQTNDTYKFYFYDGFIEGEVGLVGGYDGSPSYRNTFDGVTVYYYPLVEPKQDGDNNYQHVELASSDNAVTKTTVHGDIYYYNLQDNINTSIRTGYKIYAVRDFDASYTITSPVDTNVVFDIAGYNITINDTITINGTFTVEDSETTVSTVNVEDNSIAMPSVNGNVFVTPHDDNTTTTVTYGGLISVPQTIINNGNFVIKNARITGTTANDTIKNNATLTMETGALGSKEGGITMTPIENATYVLDKNSYIYHLGSYGPAISIKLPTFVWNGGGNIYSEGHGISCERNTKLTIQNGTIYGYNSGIYGNKNEVIIENGTIKSAELGMRSANITINDGTIVAAGRAATGISIDSGVINGGTIIAASSEYYRDTVGIRHDDCNGGDIIINDGNVIVKQTYAGTVYSYSNYAAYGIKHESVSSSYCNTVALYLNDGSISVTSESLPSYGIQNAAKDRLQLTINVTGGNVTAQSNGNIAYGLQSPKGIVSGGKITSSTYGIYSNGTNSDQTLVVGTDDGNVSTTSPEIIGGEYALYNGFINYYDGVLRGGIKAFQDGSVKAIPNAMTYHIEESEDYAENCWLVESSDYLQVGDNTYNSLSDAYGAITGDTGTITVIKDFTTDAAHPDGPANKNITLDLNGHSLTYSQPIVNNGTLTITDSSASKAGHLHNANTNAAAVVNNKTLIIDQGYYSSEYRTIENAKNSTLTINNGTLTSKNVTIYSDHANINLNGGVVSIESTNSGNQYCIYDYRSSILNIIDGQIIANRNINTSASYVSAAIYGFYSRYGGSTITIMPTGTQETVNIQSNRGSAFGIYANKDMSAGDSSITMKSGNIVVNGDRTGTSSNSAYGFYADTISIENSNIAVAGGYTYGLYTDSLDIKTSIINADGNGNYTVYGIIGGYGVVSVEDTTITANNTFYQNKPTYSVIGISHGGNSSATSTLNFKSGTITVNSGSDAYGIMTGNDRFSKTNILGGTINSTTTSTSKNAYGLSISGGSITGGLISGSSYGISSSGTSDINAIAIGENDGNISISSPEIVGGKYGLYEGYFYFYDGVLRGKTKAYNDGVIKAIPDAKTYHIEESESYKENCWLTEAADYLEVNGETFNSLADAYDAIDGDSGTIKVIDNATTTATHPSSPSGKTVTLDLNGFTLEYSQPLINGGNMIIVDNSSEKTGTLSSPNTAAPAISNNGNLTIGSGNISGAYRAIENSAGTTVNINDGTVTGKNNAIYSDGTLSNPVAINISGGTIISHLSTIYNNGYTNTTITGGHIQATSDETATSSTVIDAIFVWGDYGKNKHTITIDAGNDNTVLYASNQKGGATGIGGMSIAQTNLKSGKIEVHGSRYGFTTYGISGKLTMDDGTIDITSVEDASGIISSGGCTMNGGTITVTNTPYNNETTTTYGIYSSSDSGDIVINGGNITVTSISDAIGTKGEAVYGVDGKKVPVKLNAGSISVSSGNLDSYGIHSTSTATVTGGNIAASSRATAYGIHALSGTVTGGQIISSTYGIYSSSTAEANSINIGTNDDSLSTSSPAIRGEEYGLYNGFYNFYDGIISGKVAAYKDGVVKTIASDKTIYEEVQIYNNENYYSRYLIDAHDVAKIGNVKYESLVDAIEAVNSNETIDLIDDNYTFTNIVIPAEKTFVISTNGYDIHLGKEIVNNGKVTIVNSQTSSTSNLNYNSGGYSITNNANAELTLDNLNSNVLYGIKNNGTLIINTSAIIADDTAINNAGSLTIANNKTISGNNYSIYTNGGEAQLDSGTINGDIYINSGNLLISNSNITKHEDNTDHFITNKGSFTIDTVQLALTQDQFYCKAKSGFRCPVKAVYNTNSFTASNSSISSRVTTTTGDDYLELMTFYNDGGSVVATDSTISADIEDTDYSYSYSINNQSGNFDITNGSIATTGYNSYGIYNKTGNMVIKNNAITTSSSQSTTYGIYNDSGSVTLETGSIDASAKNIAYGINNVTGTVTIGIPELESSINYGKDTADVSITNPSIKAIHTSTSTGSSYKGIGVKNESTGKIYYYDGKITATTTAMPENPAGVEYLYEPRDYVDEETGYHYRILEWMREQANNGN